MKHINTIAAALAGAAAMWLAQPAALTIQAAAPTPCAPVAKAGPTAKPSPTVVSQGDVGKTIAVGDGKITLTKMEVGKAYSFTEAKPGNILIAVEMLVESNADKGVSSNSFYMHLSDDQGYEYSQSFGGKSPSLPSGNDLPKGKKMRGWTTFEVPADAKGLTLTWKVLTLFGDDKPAEWSLGR